MGSEARVLATTTHPFLAFIHPANVNIMRLNFPNPFRTAATTRRQEAPAPAAPTSPQPPGAAQDMPAQRRSRGMRERVKAIAEHAIAVISPARGATETQDFDKQLQDWVDTGGAPLENRADAAQRIKDARRKKRSRLDLSGLGLTTLPDCFAELPALRMLRLNDNQLTQLPESVNKISVVNVTNNPLSDMPDLNSLPGRQATGLHRTRPEKQQRLIVNL